jgi:hypothetical protein
MQLKQLTSGMILLVLAGTSMPAVADVISLGNDKYMLNVSSRTLIEVQALYKLWHKEATNICHSTNYRYSFGPVEARENRTIIIQRGKKQKSTVISGPIVALSGGLEC